MKSWGDTKPSKLLEELKRHKAPDFRCQRLVVANICLMLRVHLFVVSMMPNCRISSGDGYGNEENLSESISNQKRT